MDDSCAVCAETLQWVAYGSCGHREVCSTCVIRLRFVCEDRHCCLCKSECRIIFVTKALGDYTRMINDFAIFPAAPEGQVGAYWYHEGTQAYFDDLDHYKMIKAMCRLSCSVCDKTNEQRSEGSRRRGEFQNVEQLKSHLVHRHRLSMCSLCLESKKAFICEQKLYTKAQLNQHTRTGDSEVDGSETERGGFMGHPMCEFCQTPFYGENELYSHMSTEHYTCHICHRQHPGEYEYYKSYDDLEASCALFSLLAGFPAFLIFRHNAKEHGRRMSRCKRIAALQIPVSFQCRRSNQQDRRGRGRGLPSDLANNQLSLTNQASVETANAETVRDTSSSAGAVSSPRETSVFESIVGSFESLTTAERELSSSHASRQSFTTAPLDNSSFPPLPVTPGGGRKKTRKLSTSTASHQAWSRANFSSPPSSLLPSSNQLRSVSNSGLLSSSSSRSCLQSSSITRNIRLSPSYESTVPHASSGSASSSTNSTIFSMVTHSTSAPNLVGRGSFENSIPSSPHVSAAQTGKAPTNNQTLLKTEDVNSANKSLVERIRMALDHDEKKYAALKEISSQFRQDLISTEEYLASVCQFGLSHLVLELAKLCPDLEKQRELVETYNFNTRCCGSQENSLTNDSGRSKNRRSSKKGKEKCEENEIITSKVVLADNIISSMRILESNYKSLVGRVDILSKDSHQPAKEKSKILIDDELLMDCHQSWNESSLSTTGDSFKKISGTGGGNKQRKKTSKFLRNRLGNDAAEASELVSSNTGPDLPEEKIDDDKDPPEGLPVSGVWRNGGSQRLVTMTQRDRRKR
ncbi:zinc finger protein [Parasponia andersonii]|uniref:Zinc finger protein n=1 Tax=Parasponia andersonii TaxID=3476 RepID=A0A2P5D8L9_PARAD|nr:zinc finger protein [Parasponia andersonii]